MRLFLGWSFNQFVLTCIFLFNRGSANVLTRIPFFASLAGSRVNTPHVAWHCAWWRVYTPVTRKCFSEPEGTRFGGPGQKALPSMNEFTLLWIFAYFLYPRPVPLTYQPRICKDGFISIVVVSPVCCLFDRVLVDNRSLLQSLSMVKLCGRKTTAINKTNHLILEMSMNEAFNG